MRMRDFLLPLLGACAVLSLTACDDKEGIGTGGTGGAGTTTETGGTGGTGAAGGTGGTGGSGAAGGTGGGEPAMVAEGYYFAVDAATNGWQVTVVDPAKAAPVVATLAFDDLAALTGPNGNAKGPSWGDPVASPDGARIFVNATNADRVAVIETATPSLETLLTVGKRPLHIYNPNHGDEIWSHADDEGAFYVIGVNTLTVSAPVVAAQKGTGHGKLVYGEKIGTQYYATNTNDPGGYAIDGAAKTVAPMIALCGAPCADDPGTPEDESMNTCGGTHDKVFNPGKSWVVFQCSGATADHVAFVDTTTNTVVSDMVPMPVSAFAPTPDGAYILVFDNKNDLVKVWDTAAPDHDGVTFDAEATITGAASGRGTDFRKNEAGEWEAWIPQSTGTKLVVMNLKSMEQTEIEIGTLSPPAGASSVTRRGGLAGDWFFTNNDAGAVMVNVTTKEVVQGPAAGNVTRILAVDKHH